jgi:hypothetical protein
MFFKLSKPARDEVIAIFDTSALENIRYDVEASATGLVPNAVSAFESASLSFGKPLVLPSMCGTEGQRTVKVASNFPVAKTTDIYRVASAEKIALITQKIDKGIFISNSKYINWSRSGRYHPCHWDIKKLMTTLRSNGPMNSYQINLALPNMDRYRISAILRELRKQGILIVN